MAVRKNRLAVAQQLLEAGRRSGAKTLLRLAPPWHNKRRSPLGPASAWCRLQPLSVRLHRTAASGLAADGTHRQPAAGTHGARGGLAPCHCRHWCRGARRCASISLGRFMPAPSSPSMTGPSLATAPARQIRARPATARWRTQKFQCLSTRRCGEGITSTARGSSCGSF